VRILRVLRLGMESHEAGSDCSSGSYWPLSALVTKLDLPFGNSVCLIRCS
jgi:hypothetical protein